MRFPLDAFVVTDGNREAADRIFGITQRHAASERIFLVGPAQSGKTELVRSRQRDKDLLSTKRVLYRPCAELAEALRANVYDGFFDDLGSFEVLFLDDFEGFYEDEEAGPEICKLLLAERDRLGLDTVITSSKPLSEHNLDGFGDAIKSFEEIRIEPLQGDDLLRYVKGLVEDYTDEEKSPVLADEALEFIAFELEGGPEMKRRAMWFLLTQYQGEPGAVVSRSFVEQALEADRREEEAQAAANREAADSEAPESADAGESASKSD